MKSISIETFIKYLHESDVKSGMYPESAFEGLSVGCDVFGYLLRDGIITEDEFKEITSTIDILWKDLDDKLDAIIQFNPKSP